MKKHCSNRPSPPIYSLTSSRLVKFFMSMVLVFKFIHMIATLCKYEYRWQHTVTINRFVELSPDSTCANKSSLFDVQGDIMCNNECPMSSRFNRARPKPDCDRLHFNSCNHPLYFQI